MKIELKKISVSKSIIDQVKFASVEDIMKQREILGFCEWKMGSGKVMRRKNLFLFFTEDGEVRKLLDFEEYVIEDRYAKQNDYATRNNLPRDIIPNPFKVIVSRRGFTESEYRFPAMEAAMEFTKMLRVLKNTSLEAGQFFY